MALGGSVAGVQFPLVGKCASWVCITGNIGISCALVLGSIPFDAYVSTGMSTIVMKLFSGGCFWRSGGTGALCSSGRTAGSLLAPLFFFLGGHLWRSGVGS